MSVNISGRQSQHGDLAGEVIRALRRTGLPPRCLVLEITETVLMEDTAHNLQLLSDMKALGVLLAIDDFGTGYSSLSYLQQFPVDILKIDRSFIRDLRAGSDEAELVRTILDLARNLRLSTVAEGSRTRSSWRCCRRWAASTGRATTWPARRRPRRSAGSWPRRRPAASGQPGGSSPHPGLLARNG